MTPGASSTLGIDDLLRVSVAHFACSGHIGGVTRTGVLEVQSRESA
jgi:hypothetical protein